VIEVHVGELHASARTADNRMTLSLTGTADTGAEAALNELLGRLHGELQRSGVRDVLVDLYDLEFMNSSCFKGFVAWIAAVRGLPEDRRYAIRFRPNAALHWQRRSLDAIRHFGGDVIRVEG
jgi:hypothetical protein